jgi:hypothetical protein
MSARSSQWIVFGTLCVLLLATARAHAARLTKQVEVQVLPGWQTSLLIDWMKDGNVLQTDSQDYKNDSNQSQILEETVAGPLDTNAMRSNATTKKIPPPEINEKTASVNFPNLVPNLPAYLEMNGFTAATPFDMPIVYGDLNFNGLLDDFEASVYVSVVNLGQYGLVAHASNFPINSQLLTDASGNVHGLPGITFYSDETLSTPYANGALLVFGRDSTFVPEPSTACLAAVLALMILGGGKNSFNRRAKNNSLPGASEVGPSIGRSMFRSLISWSTGIVTEAPSNHV